MGSYTRIRYANALGILVIPLHARSSHIAALDTPWCARVHVLAALKKRFRFVPRDAWKGENT